MQRHGLTVFRLGCGQSERKYLFEVGKFMLLQAGVNPYAIQVLFRFIQYRKVRKKDFSLVRKIIYGLITNKKEEVLKLITMLVYKYGTNIAKTFILHHLGLSALIIIPTFYQENV